MAAGGRLPGVGPLAPGVDGVLFGEERGPPGALVHADLDLLDASVLGPGHSGDHDRAGLGASEGLGGVDPGLGLDRGLAGPLALHPVRVVGVERGEFDVLDPLAGGDVSVQAGDEHAHGEAVDEGQRFAVHPDREHRVPAVHHVLDGGAERHPVDGPGDDLVGRATPGRRLHPGLLEQVGEPDPDPPGVADVGAADLVGDAGEGDLPFDQRAVQQVLVGEFQVLSDALAVDAEPPGVRVDLRDHQGGVHPVERVVRGGERADAGDPQPCSCRGRLRGRGGGGQLH
ncbi:hypothetical protein SFIMM107S_03366 [Streptomyces griseus]